jgi:flap endonuclease-1
MGIKDLLKFIRKYAPNCLISTKLSDYTGKKIAIDTSLIIYRYILAMRKTGRDLLSSEGHNTSHLYGILNLIIKLFNYKITPVFIFDGKSPDIKKATLQKRWENRVQAEEKLETNIELTKEQKITYFIQSFKITSEIIDDTKKMLTVLGVPYIEAPEEADSQCISLLENNLIYAVATEDMDLLTFKCNRLLKNFFSYDEDIIEINYNKMLEDLKINDNQFLDLCILLGCDYLPRLPGLGQVKSFDYIKKYKSIKNILELNTIKKPENYNYEKVEEYFKTASSKCIVPTEDQLTVKFRENENEEIHNFLVNICKFSVLKYNRIILMKKKIISI